MSEAWTPFEWESNACWGPVRSPADWLTMVDRFARGHRETRQGALAIMLDRGATTAIPRPAGVMPSIGTRREHIGGQPLRAWAAERGMDLSVPAEVVL